MGNAIPESGPWERWKEYKEKLLSPEREFLKEFTEEGRKEEIRRMKRVVQAIEKYARKYDLDPNELMESFSSGLASARISVTKRGYEWWKKENIERDLEDIVIQEYELLLERDEISKERYEEVYDELGG